MLPCFSEKACFCMDVSHPHGLTSEAEPGPQATLLVSVVLATVQSQIHSHSRVVGSQKLPCHLQSMSASGAHFSLSSPRSWEKKHSITEIKGPSLLILYFVQTAWPKLASECYTWPSMNQTLLWTLCLSITLDGSCAGSGSQVPMVWH